MKDGDIGYASEDGPTKFHEKAYCRFCGGVQLINISSHRCAECNKVVKK